MFNCNNLSLLTFTYYLKIITAMGMTIIPLFLFEKIFIRFIKYKRFMKKIDKLFIKKELNTLFIIIIVFLLSFSTFYIINKDDNKCFMYATSDILKDYKIAYKEANKNNLKDDVKVAYLDNVLSASYSKNIKNDEKVEIPNIKTVLNNEKESNTKVQTLSNNSNTINLHETDTTKRNKVYVVDGKFYLPNYSYGNKASYSGLACPTNPEKEGYNNPYGYNNYFYTRLVNFVEAAKQNGYKITISRQGCRSYQTQVNYYNTMAKGRAANPGYSLHGFGIASDLEFYQKDGSVCSGNRTDSSCPSMGWAHKNASKYGLTFPLLYASYKEDWHIEPLTKVRY